MKLFAITTSVVLLTLTTLAQVQNNPEAFKKTCEQELADVTRVFHSQEKQDGKKSIAPVLVSLNGQGGTKDTADQISGFPDRLTQGSE